VSKEAVIHRNQEDIYWRDLSQSQPADGEHVMIWTSKTGRELAYWREDLQEFRAHNVKGFGKSIRKWCPILPPPGEED